MLTEISALACWLLRQYHAHQAVPGIRTGGVLHTNREDVGVARRFVEAGEMLDIEVLDHPVMGQQRYIRLKGSGFGLD